MRAPKQRGVQDLILDHLTALTNAEIRKFLRRHKVSGASAKAKDELRTLVKEALDAGDITTESIVKFLDEVTPWGKQHLYLYKAPSSKDWRSKPWVTRHLETHKLTDLLDALTDRIVLPEELELACITWNSHRLRVTAIRKRAGWVRNEEYDDTQKESDDGRPVWLKGYVFQVLRGITAFEWNLVSNEAFLQITQLPTGASYESVAEEFKNKVQPWLNLDQFKVVDLRPIVKKLHQMEEQGKGTVVSHALDYSRLGQRRISVRSTSSQVPLLGDNVIDGILKTVRKDGVPLFDAPPLLVKSQWGLHFWIGRSE
jgi:hypothetical protein